MVQWLWAQAVFVNNTHTVSTVFCHVKAVATWQWLINYAGLIKANGDSPVFLHQCDIDLYEYSLYFYSESKLITW